MKRPAKRRVSSSTLGKAAYLGVRTARVVTAGFLFLLVLAGCGDMIVSTEAEAEVVPGLTAEGGAVSAITTVASFDPFSGELPEGIAVDRRGNVYVSMSGLGEVWKLRPDGAFEGVVASFAINAGDTGALGLRFDPRGTLYVAVSSTNPAVNGVWRITSNGATERLAGTSGIAFPNDVAVSPRGTVYVTDSAAGAVWRYRRGRAAEVWVQDETLEGTGAFGLGVPIGANGIVITPGRKGPLARGPGSPAVGSVLVANSEKGQLVRVPILPDGSAGEPDVVLADPAALFGLDGITVDARGALYGAVNVANAIVRIDRDGGGVSTVATGPPLDFPAGLAFGAGRDRHALFISNFAVIHFFSDPPMPGNANPAVLRVEVGPPGTSG